MSYQTNTSFTVAANEVFGNIKEKAQLGMLYFSDLDRAVVKATNRDIAQPKSKHVGNIISCLNHGNLGMNDFDKMLRERMDEGSWIITYKALILINLVMNSGPTDRVFGYLSTHPAILNMTSFRDSSAGGQGLEQSKNIKAYASYLEERALAYRELAVDISAAADGESQWPQLRKRIPILSLVTERLLQTRFYVDSINNEITLESVRLLVRDLLKVFQSLNKSIVQMLRILPSTNFEIIMIEIFFNLSKVDALKALEFYKNFVDIIEKTVAYFDYAKRIEYGLKIVIPDIQHTPISLVQTLTDYVNSSDFETQRQSRLHGTTDKSLNRQQSAKNPTLSTEKALVNVFQMDDQQPHPSSRHQSQVYDYTSNGVDLFQSQPQPRPQVSNQTQYKKQDSMMSVDLFSQPTTNFGQQVFSQNTQNPPSSSFYQQQPSSSSFYQQQPPASSFYQQSPNSHPNLPSQGSGGLMSYQQANGMRSVGNFQYSSTPSQQQSFHPSQIQPQLFATTNNNHVQAPLSGYRNNSTNGGNEMSLI